MSAEEWIDTFGPLTNEDEPIELDEISLTHAIQAGHPAHGSFCIRTAHDKEVVEASAFPLVASPDGASGAMIMFWPHGVNGSP